MKDGPKRVLITISISGDILKSMIKRLEAQGKETSTKHLAELAYESIDALCK